MGQRIRSSLSLLVQAAEDVVGSKVDPVLFMRALIRRVEGSMPQDRKLAIAIGYRRLIRSYSCALHQSLASRVARWSNRALGPDVPMRASYPLYRALAESRGLEPWTFSWFQQNAYGYRKAKPAAKEDL